MTKIKNSIWFFQFLLNSSKINVLSSRNLTEFKVSKKRRFCLKKKWVRVETFQFLTTWFLSTNYFIIRILYLLLGVISGMLGTVAGLFIGLELLPVWSIGSQSSQLYNTIVTSHMLLIVFSILIPIMVGSINLKSLRVNILSFWVLLPSAVPGRIYKNSMYPIFIVFLDNLFTAITEIFDYINKYECLQFFSILMSIIFLCSIVLTLCYIGYLAWYKIVAFKKKVIVPRVTGLRVFHSIFYA